MTSHHMTQSEREAFWMKHVADWRASGLSRKAYSEQAAISQQQLYYWINKNKDDSSQEQTKGFIQLNASTTHAAQSDISVSLPNGITLQWQGQLDVRYLQSLIIVLAP